MISITLRPERPTRVGTHGAPILDIASVTWNGRTYEARSTHGSTMRLARALVAAGCEDQPWEARTPTGLRTVFGKSLHGLAGLTISERDGGGLRVERYREPPDSLVRKTFAPSPAGS
jgi:hypothetical protein